MNLEAVPLEPACQGQLPALAPTANLPDPQTLYL